MLGRRVTYQSQGTCYLSGQQVREIKVYLTLESLCYSLSYGLNFVPSPYPPNSYIEALTLM